MGLVERLRNMIEMARLHSEAVSQQEQLSMYLVSRYRRAGFLIITYR